ncbi:lytic polysaccharide monooxygenase [Viridothelium virens]|uniref:Lytic polysaccharide monooxygenase n=1 Tax=Viridothelium virens TaxID=1048519 RepID=A0A6A6H5F0_VIRVR|nr:lytic polysaccharide monooxygenase [Viridothelium virens]
MLKTAYLPWGCQAITTNSMTMMTFTMTTQFIHSLCIFLSFFTFTSAHIEMSWPYPLRSKLNSKTPQSLMDYSMTAPLDASGSNFPCKGYQANTPLDSVASLSAGSQYNMTLDGSATHGGGSCQISLSYDNGATFRVIKSIIGGCPFTEKYDYTIPSFAPSGKVLLAWSWQNHEGNREFYMNCASVKITGSPSSRRRKRQSSSASSMNDLPNIWVANLPEVNKCTTSEGVDPVYPDPGPEVEYGAGLSKSSPPSPKNCEDSSPGPAYKNVEGSNGGSGSSSAASSANSGATSSAAPIASSSPNASGMIGLSSASAAPVATSTAPYSVVPVDGGPTATSNPGGVFVPETTSAASAATSDASTSTSNFRISHTTITMTISETTTVTTTHHPSTSSSQSSTAPLQITSTTLGSYSANRVASVSTEPGLYSSTSPTYPVVVKPLPTPTVASNLDCPIPAAFPLTLTSASDLYVPIPLSRAPIFTPTTPLPLTTPPLQAPLRPKRPHQPHPLHPSPPQLPHPPPRPRHTPPAPTATTQPTSPATPAPSSAPPQPPS